MKILLQRRRAFRVVCHLFAVYTIAKYHSKRDPGTRISIQYNIRA